MSSKFIAVLAQVTKKLVSKGDFDTENACRGIWNYQRREIDNLKNDRTEIGKSLNSAVKVSISAMKELKESKMEVACAKELIVAIMHEFPEVADFIVAVDKKIKGRR